MTLVVVWIGENEIDCWADTRISQGKITLSETGGKILIVPVTYTASDDIAKAKAEHYSVGIAFAGSTLLAQNTQAIASTCCQIIHSKDGAPPPMRLIAEVYARVAEFVIKDFNSRWIGEPQLFQALLFGWSPPDDGFKVFALSPIVGDAKFEIRIIEYPARRGDVYAIGSGMAEFEKASARKNALGHNRPPQELFMEVFEKGAEPTVGGHPQFARVTQGGAEVVPILMQDPENPDFVTLRVNGFNVHSLADPNGFQFGLKAQDYNVPKVAGRQALRAKGIDPDKPITRGIQNVASMEMAIREAYRGGQSLFLNTIYTHDALKPGMGGYYFGTKCSCGTQAPFCIDPSRGKWCNFSGPGAVAFKCWKCGTRLRAVANQIFSFLWSIPTA